MVKFNFLVAVLLLTQVKHSQGLQCHGSDSLDETQTLSCKTNSRLAELTKSQSCVKELLTGSNELKCNSASSCLEVNIQLKAGSFEDTDNTIWSLLSCYKEDLEVRICADGAATTTTTMATTTLPSSTTSSVSTSTQSNAVSSSSQGFNATGNGADMEEEVAHTTTEEYTTSPRMSTTTTNSSITSNMSSVENVSTTTDTMSTTTNIMSTSTFVPSSTSSSTSSPYLEGCLTGMIQLDSTCTQVSYEIQLSDGNTEYSTDVYVVDCCSDNDLCGSHTTVPPDTILCRFGESTQVYCDSCWAYLLRSGGETRTWYGCLADIPLIGSSFYGADSCTLAYETGACSDAGDEKECIRCCQTASCNDASIDTFIPQTGESGNAVIHHPAIISFILSIAVTIIL